MPPLPVQRKLAVGSSDDPLEREADRAAHAALDPHGSAIPAQRPGRAAPALTQAPPLLHRVLRSPGQRLDDATQTWAESAFQSGFGDVRIHTGPEAAESAAQVHAHAYTVGRDIVLGRGRQASDRPLLAHELAHVVQQGMASPQPVSGESRTHAPVLHRASSPLVQRQAADPQDTRDRDLGWRTEAIIVVGSGPARAMGETPYDLVHAMWHGFFSEIKDHGGEAAEKVWTRAKDFVTSPSQLLMFFPKYWWGLLKGIASPITGLFDLVRFGVQLEEIARHAIESAWENREKIAADAKDLASSMRSLGGKAKDAVKGFFSHPIETVSALGPLLDQAKSEATAAAERGGHKIAKMLMDAADQPIPDLAEVGGEVIGTVVVNVVLFIFTDGIGDAITQIAGKLGELAGWLAKLGKGAKMLAGVVTEVSELLVRVGGWVTRVETFIGKMISTVLKPLEPVLEEFGGLMGRLRTFLRDLLGVAEKSEVQEASAAAKALGGAGKEVHPPAQPVHSEPHGGTGGTPHPEHVSRPPAEPKKTPHVTAHNTPPPGPEAKPHLHEEAPAKPAPNAVKKTASAEQNVTPSQEGGGTPAVADEGTAPARPRRKPRPQPKEKPRQIDEPAPRKPVKAKKPRDPVEPKKTRQPKKATLEKPQEPAKTGRTKKGPLDSKAQTRAAERLRQQQAAEANAIHEQHASREKLVELDKKIPGLAKKAKGVPAPASLLKDQRELGAIKDFQEKLERLREIRSSRSNWSDAEKKYFDSHDELWQAKVDQEAARYGMEHADAGRVDADIQVPEAERALRRASRRISEILRSEGDNFKSVSKLTFDQTLGKDAWKVLEKKPALETEHLVSIREIEDTINHSDLPHLHSEASPAMKEEMEKEFQKLGDIRDNLTRMRRDANNFKSDSSWHDISYKDAARFGYTKEMLDGLRETESAQRAIIKERIENMVATFTKKIRGR